MRGRRSESGFTMIEIMVSLVVLVLGLLGIMALQATTVRGNRMSRELERARVYATAIMEDLRQKDGATLTGGTLEDVTTDDGVTYQRSYSVSGVAGNLRLITVQVTFHENGEESETHTATLQMIRTTLEKM